MYVCLHVCVSGFNSTNLSIVVTLSLSPDLLCSEWRLLLPQEEVKDMAKKSISFMQETGREDGEGR